MKLSIVVPIYNVEMQLIRCIESLLKQQTEKLETEIILVNDGSTDNSGSIARKYAESNTNVIYIEKKNAGLSDARNVGVKHCNGDYIAFVDSDDYVSDNLYMNLMQYMQEDYDMVKFKIAKVQENGDTISHNNSPEFEEKTGEEAFEILYKSDVMTEVAWAYLYKRSFYIDNSFEFAKGLYHEDFGLIPLMLLKAKKVASTNVGFYNYVQTENSITRGSETRKQKGAQDLLKHYDNMINVIERYRISDKSKENIKIYYTNCIILEVNNLAGKNRKEYIKQIRKRKMTKNIKARNFKQLIKKIILNISIEMYLKIR